MVNWFLSKQWTVKYQWIYTRWPSSTITEVTKPTLNQPNIFCLLCCFAFHLNLQRWVHTHRTEHDGKSKSMARHIQQFSFWRNHLMHDSTGSGRDPICIYLVDTQPCKWLTRASVVVCLLNDGEGALYSVWRSMTESTRESERLAGFTAVREGVSG